MHAYVHRRDGRINEDQGAKTSFDSQTENHKSDPFSLVNDRVLVWFRVEGRGEGQPALALMVYG